MKKSTNIILWVLRIVVAFILVQTLFFKFSAAPESVYIFETVGIEPWGRIGSGVVELIASILLLIPKTTWAGAVLTLGTISGAIFFHLTKLGIEVKGDGGQLFIMALVVFFSALVILLLTRKQIPLFSRLLK